MQGSQIQLIGGEPLSYPDFYKILEYAHDCGIKRIDVFSNGTLITDSTIIALKKYDTNVRISLYGHNAQTHDKITKKAGSFKKLDQTLKSLIKNKITTSVAVIIMRENEKYVEDIKYYIESIGLKYNGYDTIRNVRGGTQQDHLLTDIDLLKPRYQSKPKFSTSKYNYYLNQQWNNCWFGKFAVTASGDILPCIFAREDVCGNIKTDSKEKLKHNLIYKWKITKDQIDICKDCEYRYACHDCRPLSIGITSNNLGKYSRCCYDPYTGSWLSIEQITQEIKK